MPGAGSRVTRMGTRRADGDLGKLDQRGGAISASSISEWRSISVVGLGKLDQRGARSAGWAGGPQFSADEGLR
jgi:hypothetical protein